MRLRRAPFGDARSAQRSRSRSPPSPPTPLPRAVGLETVARLKAHVPGRCFRRARGAPPPPPHERGRVRALARMTRAWRRCCGRLWSAPRHPRENRPSCFLLAPAIPDATAANAEQVEPPIGLVGPLSFHNVGGARGCARLALRRLAPPRPAHGAPRRISAWNARPWRAF